VPKKKATKTTKQKPVKSRTGGANKTISDTTAEAIARLCVWMVENKDRLLAQRPTRHELQEQFINDLGVTFTPTEVALVQRATGITWSPHTELLTREETERHITNLENTVYVLVGVVLDNVGLTQNEITKLETLLPDHPKLKEQNDGTTQP
jgi:hypothetical protein